MKSPDEEQIRSLPCNIVPEDELWALCGEKHDADGSVGGGVLEWCYNEEDARNEMARLYLRKDLKRLSISKWKT